MNEDSLWLASIPLQSNSMNFTFRPPAVMIILASIVIGVNLVLSYIAVNNAFNLHINNAKGELETFSDEVKKRPILPTGTQLLEVKYDEYLPDPIYHALMLDNMQRLDIKGGAIVIEENVVAFTLGSPINESIYNIHIEKAPYS